MADDIKVVIGVDDTSVLQSIDRVSRLEKGYKRLDAALNKGKIGPQEYAKGVQQLDAAIKRATTSTKAFQQAQMAATKSSNRMGVVTQQAGYQVSDFIVQIQSGTNPFVAFSQQASQLAGVLPLVASQLGLTTTAAIGLSAALGIAIPIIGLAGASLLTYFNLAKDAKSATETFENSLSELKSTLKGLDIKSLQNDFGRFASEVRDVELSVLDLKATLLRADFSSAAEQLGADFSNGFKDSVISGIQAIPFADLIMKTTSQKVAAMGFEPNIFGTNFVEGITKSLVAGDVELAALQFENLLNTVKATEEGFNGINAEGKNLLITLAKMINRGYDLEKNTEEVLENLNNWGKPVFKATKDFTSLNGIQQKTLDAQISLFEKSQELTEEIGQAGKEALILAGVDINKPIDDAQKSAAKLVTELGVSLGLAEKLVSISAMGPQRALFAAKVRAGVLPPQAAGDFDVEGGETPFALQQYLDYVNGKAKDKPKKTKRDPLADLQKQVELEQALIGKTEARQRIIKTLGVDLSDYNEKTINDLEAQINRTIMLENAERDRQRALEEARQKQEELANDIAGSMGDAFLSIVDGTKSVKDAFQDMARYIIRRLYEILVVEQMVQSISGAIGGAMAGPVQGPPAPSANGNIFSNGSIVPFANGGIVGSPLLFPMAGGRTGLMGEAGPEAIMPLKRGKNGKLGVASEGGGNVTVNQTFAFQANGDESVKKIIAQQAPKIAQMTTQQIMDSRRRGGQMKAVFG
jgi:hypothetical protein